MKRTELRRKTPLKRSPMKRGASMKRTSAKKSSTKKTPKEPKHQDRKARQAYAAANPGDEWFAWLEIIPAPFGAEYDQRRFMLNECNHIFSNPRRDEVPLMIVLSKRNHDFFHQHIDAGRVLCMLVKCLKFEDDLPLWDLAFGKRVSGWVESQRFTGALSWVESYRLRLLNCIRSKPAWEAVA